eukprot:6179544-Pleurochrysis_carterae.AAC.5
MRRCARAQALFYSVLTPFLGFFGAFAWVRHFRRAHSLPPNQPNCTVGTRARACRSCASFKVSLFFARRDSPRKTAWPALPVRASHAPSHAPTPAPARPRTLATHTRAAVCAAPQIIYPLRDFVHPNAFCDMLAASLPLGFAAPIGDAAA